MNTPTTGLPHWTPGMDRFRADEMNRLFNLVRELANRIDQREPNLAPGIKGGGVGVKTVRIVSISALLFSCKNHDINGNEVGTAFDVSPWVVDADGYMLTGYDLTATGLPRVIPKYTVGRYLRIYTSMIPLRRAAPGGPTVARWWAVDTFHLISC